MPELPEVEALKRLVDSHCLGAVIVKAIVENDAKVIEGLSPAALQDALTGKKIVSTHRKGKHLWLQLDSPPWPSFQFGMSGAIIVKGVKGPEYKRSKVSDTEEFPSTYSKVHLQLDSGVEVAFTDKRRFARVRLFEDPSKVAPISELGFDAYLELPSAKELIQAFKSRKGAVKALLLDQTFLSGLGNWVADEVLYQSKIHPEQSASSLKEDEVTRLHDAIQEVLDKAVSVDADSEQFPKSWLFHQRWDKKPGLIDGNQIQTITISGRTSAFVPNIQKYSGPELKGAKTKGTENDMARNDEGVIEPEANLDADAGTGEVADKAGTSETPKRGRGRPPKAKPENAAVAVTLSKDSPGSAKKRGRPPKTPLKAAEDAEETTEKDNSPSEPKRGRGRPPKVKTDASKEAVSKALEEAPAKAEDAEEENNAGDASPVTPKRRGRPPKAKPEAPEETEVVKKAKKDEEGAASPAGSAEPKKRGRPAKAKPDIDVVVVAAAAATSPTPEPKKRGRPPKA